MKFFTISFVTLSFPMLALAADCAHLRENLEGLRKTQNTIMMSLANNHELFAESFEEVNSELEMNHKRIPSPFLDSMKKTSSSFRDRGIKGKVQAEKLDKATEEMIDEVVECMNKTVASK